VVVVVSPKGDEIREQVITRGAAETVLHFMKPISHGVHGRVWRKYLKPLAPWQKFRPINNRLSNSARWIHGKISHPLKLASFLPTMRPRETIQKAKKAKPILYIYMYSS
jgi:hypothetical protein